MAYWAGEAWFLPVVGAAYTVALVGAGVAAGSVRKLWPLALGAALFLLGWLGLGPRWPAEWLTSFREWFSEDHLRMVVGESTQAGPLLQGFWQEVLGLRRTGYRELVAVNLGAALFAVAVLTPVCVRIGGRAAGLLPVVWLLSPSGLMVALSETEAALAAAHLAVMAACGLVMVSEGGRRRAGAAVAFVALGGALCLLRAELVALVLAGLVGWGLAGRLVRVEARWTAAVDDAAAVAAAWPWLVPVVVGAWVVVAERILPYPRWLGLDRFGQVTWAVAALDPLNDRAPGLVVLWASLLPAGMVLAALRGLWEALRQPLRHGLALPALWVLWGAWYLAAHGGLHGSGAQVSPWELVRYTALAMPVVLLLAARGLAVATPRWRTALVVMLLVPPQAWLIRLLAPAHADRTGGPDLTLAGLFSHDQAREMQQLVAQVDAEPACAILSRGVPWGPTRDSVALRWVAALPDGPGVRFRTADGADLAAGLALIADAPCAVGWWSVDCGLVGGEDGCAALDGLEPLEVREWRHAPFLHPAHGGRWPDAVARVGSLRLPGVPARESEVSRPARP